MTAATAARIGSRFEDFQKPPRAEIPVRRVGQPEDVAHGSRSSSARGPASSPAR